MTNMVWVYHVISLYALGFLVIIFFFFRDDVKSQPGCNACESLSSADAVMGFTVCPLFSMLTGMIRLVVALFGDSLMRAMLPEAQVRSGIDLLYIVQRYVNDMYNLYLLST